MYVVSIVGARPQYIKLSPLHRELKRLRIRHDVINTGQHYDYAMAGSFFRELRLPDPIADLKVGSAPPAEMTARVLSRCARVLRRLRPDLVIVYGDTNSTLGGALASAQVGVPLAHLEAGLRCFDLTVPEELNRVITDRIALYHFCPTPQAVANLKSEGINNSVFLTGDVLYDVLATAIPNGRQPAALLGRLGLKAGEYFLATLHRSDSVDNRERLGKLIDILTSIDEPILFPVHPRTSKRLRQYGLLRALKGKRNVLMIEPLSYRETLAVLQNCAALLTDSGGLQREAYYLKTPTFILREVTEWVEIIAARGAVTVGFDVNRFRNALKTHRFHFGDRSVCRRGAASRVARLIKRLAR